MVVQSEFGISRELIAIQAFKDSKTHGGRYFFIGSVEKHNFEG